MDEYDELSLETLVVMYQRALENQAAAARIAAEIALAMKRNHDYVPDVRPIEAQAGDYSIEHSREPH